MYMLYLLNKNLIFLFFVSHLPSIIATNTIPNTVSNVNNLTFFVIPVDVHSTLSNR